MNYFETFIQVAPDCPVKAAVVPAAIKGEKKSIAVLEFEMLSRKPYFYTQGRQAIHSRAESCRRVTPNKSFQWIPQKLRS
jgi:hypothetical protein